MEDVQVDSCSVANETTNKLVPDVCETKSNEMVTSPVCATVTPSLTNTLFYVRNDAYNFWLIILLALFFVLLILIYLLQHMVWTPLGVFILFAVPIATILLAFAVISDAYVSGRCNLWSSGSFWLFIIFNVLLLVAVFSAGGAQPHTTSMLFIIISLIALIMLIFILARTRVKYLILSLPMVITLLALFAYVA